MTRNDIIRAPLAPDITLERLIDSHGLWTTLRALARVLKRRRQRPAHAVLSNHLRRDIGLPPAAETRRHWEIR